MMWGAGEPQRIVPPDFLLDNELRMEMMRDMMPPNIYGGGDSDSQSHDSNDDDIGRPMMGGRMKHVMKMMQNIPAGLA